jgi:hypothetical protein
MTHKEITKAISDLLPNAEFVLSGDDYSAIQWLDKRPKPTLAEIETAIANPLPEVEPSLEEKLQNVGLSLDDLKAALGL